MRCLVRTKACKRCGGDLSPEGDYYGTYLQCIQCGAVSQEQPLKTFRSGAKSENCPEGQPRTARPGRA